MKLMLCNFRGWGWPDFSNQFNFLCSLNALDVFCIVEPKSNPDSGLSACLSKPFIKLFFAKGYGRAGGVCLCWNEFIINLTIIAHNIIFIHCEVTEKCSNKQFFYSLVFMLTLKKVFNPNCGMNLFLCFQIIIMNNLGC